MSDNVEMVLVGNARYRREDARRLGLLTDDVKVLGRNSRQVEREHTAPSGLITTSEMHLDERSPGAELTSPDGVPERPGKSGTKAAWQEYAAARGKTAEELDGLKRDDIAALFPETE